MTNNTNRPGPFDALDSQVRARLLGYSSRRLTSIGADHLIGDMRSLVARTHPPTSESAKTTMSAIAALIAFTGPAERLDDVLTEQTIARFSYSATTTQPGHTAPVHTDRTMAAYLARLRMVLRVQAGTPPCPRIVCTHIPSEPYSPDELNRLGGSLVVLAGLTAGVTGLRVEGGHFAHREHSWVFVTSDGHPHPVNAHQTHVPAGHKGLRIAVGDWNKTRASIPILRAGRLRATWLRSLIGTTPAELVTTWGLAHRELARIASFETPLDNPTQIALLRG